MTKEQTLNIVGRIYGAFARPEPQKHQLIAWHEAMDGVDYETALLACRAVIRNEATIPSVATFLAYVETAQGISVPSLVEAETEVRRALVEQGRYRVPTFSHPAITRTVEAIGWHSICDQSESEWHWQFAKTYEVAVRQSNVETRSPALPSAMARSLGEAFGV